MTNNKQIFCTFRYFVDIAVVCVGLCAWLIIICSCTKYDYAIYAIESNVDYDLWGKRLDKQAFGELQWLLDIAFGIDHLHYLQKGVRSGSFVLTKELVYDHFVAHHNIMMDAVVQLGKHFKIYYLADLIEQYMKEYNTCADWLYKKCAEQGIPVDVSPHRRYFRFTPRKF